MTTVSTRPLPLVGTGSRVLSPAERFPRDFWLTPRTVLTRKTPMSKLQTFCIRHGKLLAPSLNMSFGYL